MTRCSMTRRFFLAGACAALWPMGASAVSIFPFIPAHYTFSRDQVQTAVARKFPFRKQVAQVFDLTLSDPVVTLLPDTNRIAVAVATVLSSPFMGRPITGTLALDSQLRYDPSTLSVLLVSPQVTQADFGAASAPYGDDIKTAASALATQLLDQYPIYTFKPDQLSFAGVRVAPGAIKVLRDGVQVEIVQG